MSNYKALAAVPVGDKVVHVAFKLKEFRSPVIGEGVIDIVSLVKKEEKDLSTLVKELKKKNPDVEKVAEIESRVSLPAFMSSYVESGQETNAIFDILPEKEFKEATIGETKVDLKEKNDAQAVKIEELEAQLSEKETLVARIEELEAQLSEAAKTEELEAQLSENKVEPQIE